MWVQCSVIIKIFLKTIEHYDITTLIKRIKDLLITITCFKQICIIFNCFTQRLVSTKLCKLISRESDNLYLHVQTHARVLCIGWAVVFCRVHAFFLNCKKRERKKRDIFLPFFTFSVYSLYSFSVFPEIS